ncbi:putative MFS family arabinose efflux permease [Dyadobacter jejuensis]|uniref:Putative MFS family arabinose efflux permease n=1 Tax=Dyadobacter jejuensis TaxID=1082580 RepID=A0A316AJ70_9BACT|nr:MFS transporter [Dyadobacter jejuensis]PWJ57855.1 putative MFS family arabinose efflux permease [Dyadobacter jejuensis]
MKFQDEKYLYISTLLAFILIPLGGLTTDIYIPSLPAMAEDLSVPVEKVQISLLLFMVSSGFSQLFIGIILDSFGRYRISIFALITFSLASFTIALAPQIDVIYLMRIVQGISVSLIIVGKRAFFVDMFKGEKLKHYTSLFSIVWATAPIVAPLIGGYLQVILGWQSNFYLLGILAIIILIFELQFTGESLRNFQVFKRNEILAIYRKMLGTPDFYLGLIIIGLSYSLLVIYGMISPFIIEKVYGFSPVVTGYSSLGSGIALMSGGIISKLLIRKGLFTKIVTTIILMLIIVLIMLAITSKFDGVLYLLGFTLTLHLISGFIFNNVYVYNLQRFTTNAGVASGLTGGGVYVVSSIVGYGLINLFEIKDIQTLTSVNALIISLLFIAILFFRKAVIKLSRITDHALNQQASFS